MDIRIEKTERAIKAAFMELRAQKPLEKIKIKDLCTLAEINKSTFYAHYQDIYALADQLENELIDAILASLPEFDSIDIRERSDWLARELFRAFVAHKRDVEILFSGSRQGLFANRIEAGLRAHLNATDPTFAADPARGIVLSFCVQGCYYAFANHSGQMDENRLVALLAAIAHAAQRLEA